MKHSKSVDVPFEVIVEHSLNTLVVSDSLIFKYHYKIIQLTNAISFLSLNGKESADANYEN